MHYIAVASDYDGTLAHDGQVDAATLAALDRLATSGRRFILVTGRQLDDLAGVFPHLDRCARVVAENGAVVHDPATNETRALGAAPPPAFTERLRARGVPFNQGAVIVATWEPHQAEVLEAIRDLGLEHQVIFNKGAVMVLPPGINKGSGLRAALDDLHLSPHNVVAVGDAENDHALLELSECAVAVANALPTLRAEADIITTGAHGAGVAEIIDHLIANDLVDVARSQARHAILIGTRADGAMVSVPPQDARLLIVGPSGAGKSTLVAGMLERLGAAAYQHCLVDPEGDYEQITGVATLGDAQRPPDMLAITRLLDEPEQSLAVNLLGVQLDDRPEFVSHLVAAVVDLRAHTGRPHWLILDEAHHLLPQSWAPASLALPQGLDNVVMVTVKPDLLARPALDLVTTIVAFGDDAAALMRDYAAAVGAEPPPLEGTTPLEHGQALLWARAAGDAPVVVHLAPSQTQHQRHIRKYAEGDLHADISFYFRGPEGALHLRANNLMLFAAIAEGVDDATWTFHLRRHDYSRWFRDIIKDDALADEVAATEGDESLAPAESRARVLHSIQSRYTLPA